MNNPDATRTARRAIALSSALMFGITAANADVEISAKPTSNMTCTASVCSPTAKKAVLNVGDLEAMLASGDLTVTSNNLAHDIEVDAKVGWSGTSRLTLDSYHSIAFNKRILVSGIGALTITTSDGDTNGDFRFFGKGRIEFRHVSSDLTIQGNQYALARSMAGIKSLVGNGHGHGAPFIALARDINAAGLQRKTLRNSIAVMEGLGNTISNLVIRDTTSRSGIGLFAGVGDVRDLGLINADIAGLGSEQTVGAIEGEVLLPIDFVKYCFVTGTVSATGSESRAGGLVGASAGLIALSRSDASVSVGSDRTLVGGLLGENVAGDAGTFQGVISQSYATGAVTGGDGANVGGLVGYNLGGTIENSYATGAATGGNNSFVGTLAGGNAQSDTSNPTTSDLYSTGAVSGGPDAMIGGLIGQDLAQTGNGDDYWNLDTSSISDPSRGAGNVANDPGVTGLTDTQLKSGLPAGFDRKIWAQRASINNGYPYLIANPPPG